jgi:hypothetical protein
MPRAAEPQPSRHRILQEAAEGTEKPICPLMSRMGTDGTIEIWNAKLELGFLAHETHEIHERAGEGYLYGRLHGAGQTEILRIDPFVGSVRDMLDSEARMGGSWTT